MGLIVKRNRGNIVVINLEGTVSLARKVLQLGPVDRDIISSEDVWYDYFTWHPVKIGYKIYWMTYIRKSRKLAYFCEYEDTISNLDKPKYKVA